MRNAIYLRRKLKLDLPPGGAELPPGQLATLLKNVEALGFTFAPALVERARTLTPHQLSELYGELVPALTALVGAHVTFKPMYPNFPREVMEASRAELYLNALIHYLTGDLPEHEAEPRSPLIDTPDLRVIQLGDEEDFRQICRRLLGAKTSISQTDKEDVAWFVEAYRDQLDDVVPREIPSRENVAHLGGLLLTLGAEADKVLFRHVKTATDVLRLAAALSGGDISLAEPTRFRSFRRAERRRLLALLEYCPNLVEDMLRHKGPWIRLGERLHPFEFQQQYPKVYAAFDTLRNDRPFQTFNAAIERALLSRNAVLVTDMLSDRPGDLARRLDHLLRLGGGESHVLRTFADAALRVATPVLLQVLTHFAHRPERPALRTVFPKGNVAKVQALENRLPPLDAELCAQVVALCRDTLLDRFRRLPPLGRVFVDERLRGYLVPFSQRSASKALRTIARGSRLPLPPGATIRFFLWWKEGEVDGKPTGRVDIDLSAGLYDASWRYREHISYTNLKSATYQAAHSGDIVEAPDGACEFIDLDIDSVVRYGGRYVVMSLNSFTEQPYRELPECFAGWMMRSRPQSGEIFDPRTVQDKVDLTADTRICLPVILDLVERTVVWADLALRKHPRWYNNVEGNQRGMELMGRAMTTLVKPDLYELFLLHAQARGTLAPRAEAETVFAVDAGVTPFDVDVIISEYLTQTS